MTATEPDVLRAANRVCVVVAAGFAAVTFSVSGVSVEAAVPVIALMYALTFGSRNTELLGETRELDEEGSA